MLKKPVLARPALLGTDQTFTISTLEGLEEVLKHQYRINDLEEIRLPLQASGPFQIEIASASVGDIALVSVQGSPMALAVDPLQQLCVLALPSAGWGQYQLDSYRIDNAVGETIAFIPPYGWRLVNDSTGGTAIHFRLEALIARMGAISGGRLDLVAAAAALAYPFAINIDDARTRYYYRHLLAALDLLDSSYRLGFGAPDPRLGLDDLILRSIALLLDPQLGMAEASLSASERRTLAQAVDDLMAWMVANLDQPISLSELEQRSNYGRRSLQQGFKDAVGCGPMQWLRRQRLESALQQLLQPGQQQSIAQVARSCGYLNLASFSRDFHQRFGCPASHVMRSALRSRLR